MLLWAGQFVNTAGLMMLVPIMPFYLKDMGIRGVAETQTWAGVAIAAPALALTVATPLWGRLGDRVGRKWMVVRALLGLASAMVVMALAFSPVVLVAGRLLQGALGGVVEAAAAFAGSAGSDKKRGSSLGKSFSATAAGALVGPIAGGLFVGAGGLRQLMFVIAVAAVVLAVGCAVGLGEPERARPSGRERSRKNRRGVLSVPGAVPLALAAVGVYFGVYGLIPVFAEHVSGIVTAPNSASLWVGVLHSVMWGATLLGSFWWGKRNDVTGRPVRAFALAAGGCAVSIAAVVLPLGPLAVIPLRLVQGFCFAALAQSLFLHFSHHAPEERKSSLVSTANSFLLIGQSAGPLLAGPLVLTMPVSGAVLVMAAASGLACVLALGPARAEKHAAAGSVGHDRETGEETTQLPAVEPAIVDAPSKTTQGPNSICPGVNVRPFGAWMLAPERLHRLADRRATPWDRTDGRPDARRAVHVVDEWKRNGVVVRQPQEALYAYEQTGPLGWQRGLISAVHLDSRLLPHEDVSPVRAEDMAEFMRASGMNFPPILLGYSGDGRTTEHLDTATRHAPVAQLFTTDGQEHRVWRVQSSAAHAAITDELRTRPAFIADGHHRYTAARQFRRQLYAAGYGRGPWDYLPGVLVDTQYSPLQMGPLHRELPYVNPRHILAAAARCFRITALRGPLEEWIDVLRAHARRGPAFIIATRQETFLLTDPHPGFLNDAVGRLPDPVRTMHLTVLDSLINKVWAVPEQDIRYEPSATCAVRRVHEHGGLAILVMPPTQRSLQAAAAAGSRLPYKATTFGPKPHPSLVLRTLGTFPGEVSCRAA
ncbi:MFS transporter [Saccharopolyspora sp. NFXS83]|uniref:MFS transporter n=1 Tax=Saccharopolyspora sp. NFXS83 TaxID=2993560 RepID=UPI00224B0AB2|nr:MFS transporter [Saccharopolyspora sp. NFXS83]MCX2731719.1 MFS transporter [Saccharopolyspora sp. NFXS83]